MSTKEEAYSQISALVERFSEQLPSYKKSDYNETLTRKDFIDPFFKALGWDMNNSQGNAEAYREVIHEDKIKIGSATKAPDYSFRLPGGKRLFFVEAKKPSVYVKDEILPAYQVRRYAWSAKLPISILTDFEEFAVYDCKKKPNISDKASTSRIKYLTYKDYLPEFDFIWDNFSKEKVLKGGFDKYVQSDSNKKGTSTVDKEFLVSLDEWRKQLAQNIALRNSNLNEDEINYTVQQTLDRLIFLRIAEDRGVEEYGRLKSYLSGAEYYQNLFQYFKEADSKYNSGLFNFKKDTLSAALVLDNKVIKNILNELYYPISPYEFSVLSVEILGSAYEQFLGKQIRLTAGHKAVIEEKPEVRKAGGVYYTPQYIVDYIVENTVGKLTDKKTPEEIAKLKIVDPACGSGSFLIGAYQYLLNWHQQYYKPKFDELTAIAASNEHTTKQRTDAQKERNRLPLTPDGNLTTAVKKQILTNNIFGVDIDAQAVEVTKLSLMLKCMEGETKSSLAAQMQFGERVLPTLDDNIKSGNSLIDMDFYDTEFDFGENRKTKPFSWKNGFPKVFKDGGFDVVIGNPPYVFGRDWKSLGIGDGIKSYLGSHYKSSPYQLDFFSIFMEKGIELVKESGFTSFIVPNVWLTNTYSSSTRKFLLANSSVLKIAVPEHKVFEGITVDTVVYILKKGKAKTTSFIISKLTNSEESLISELDFTEYATGEKPISTSLTKGGISLIEKIKNNTVTLGEIADITRGVHPYRTGGFGKSAFKDGQQIQKDVDERPYHSKQPKPGYRPFIYGKDLKCNTKTEPKEYILYGKWLAEPRDEKFFEGDRIYSRKILGKTLIVTAEKENSVADQQVYITKPHDKSISVYYLSAILGSKLISFFIRNYFDELNDAFPQIKVGQLKSLPIKIGSEKKQSELNKLVLQLLNLNEEKPKTNLSDKLNQLEARIKYTDDKINQLVFELYGLSEEEVGIIV
jgi:type I restriction-modification system DNA methylase subunit